VSTNDFTGACAEEEITEIRASIPRRFARGWHCLDLADRFKDGKPHLVDAFGTKLVVFQGESGKLNVLNAFCPHLGGNLGEGTIKGEAIACPFHDWRWGGDGRCAGIPYAKRVPPRARTRSWPTMERNGQLLVWNDPEGSQPTDAVTIPVLEGHDHPDWNQWTWYKHVVHTNTRELVDNLADIAHFFYIHGEGKVGAMSYFKNSMDRHFATQWLEGGTQPGEAGPYPKDQVYTGTLDGLHGYQRGETTYHGPAYLVSRLLFKTPEDQVEAVEVLAHYPISHNSFMLNMGFITRKSPVLPAEHQGYRHDMITKMLYEGTMQDVRIWGTKTRIDNPLLCDTDGPIYQLRRWYEQFFVDAKDIKPEMVAPFDFEVDTRHAIPVWNEQAAEKIAAEQTAAAAKA